MEIITWTLIWLIIVIILFVIATILQIKNIRGFKQISKSLDELEALLDKELEIEQYLNNTKQMFECPYDCERRSCKHMNTATGYTDISCHDCDWFDSGVRPLGEIDLTKPHTRVNKPIKIKK